jgi:hypothetical protein
MKKIILLLLITFTFASSAFADRDRGERREEFDRRPHPDARWNNDAGWLLPAIIGGALVYGAINSQPRPPVISQPQQQYYPVEPNRPQEAPMGFHWEQILDANCNCYRVVMVRN